MDGTVGELLLRLRQFGQEAAVGAISARNIEENPIQFLPYRLMSRIPELLRAHAYRGGALRRDGGVEEVRTFTNSGTLIPTEVLRATGPFDEALFLDAVDYEYSLRLRSRGLHLFEVTRTGVRHQLGERYEWGVAGQSVPLRSFGVQRHYHIVRDTMVFARRWWRRFPRDVAGILVSMAAVILGASLVLPNHTLRLKAIIVALYDAGHATNA